MVYHFEYEPAGSSFPKFELVEGGSKVIVEDQSADGGVGILGNSHFSGRKVLPDSIPRVIRRFTKRSLQDLEGQLVNTVSDRLKRLIESLEPDTHQFLPVQYINAGDETIETRWFWQICNRLDTVHREQSDAELVGLAWREREGRQRNLVLDVARIGNAMFWCDKHLTLNPFMSEKAHTALTQASMTGFRFTKYYQA